MPSCALEKNDFKNHPFYLVNQVIYYDELKIGNFVMAKKHVNELKMKKYFLCMLLGHKTLLLAKNFDIDQK